MPLFPARPDDVLDSRFEDSVYDPGRLPAPDPEVPEIAFAGRSNVGKSSLINALIGRKNLARTSNTPGKTRALNLYRCRVKRARAAASGGLAGDPGRDVPGGAEGELLLIDLPGYGYAQVSKQERRQWAPLVESFLTGRASLWGVVLVVDGRRPPTDSDEQMADYLGQSGIPWLAALTKTDKTKQSERARVREASEGLLRSLGARDLLQLSATDRKGSERLWSAIASLK